MKRSNVRTGIINNENLRSAALLVLRLVVGFFMLTHGWQKISNFQLYSDTFPDPLGMGSFTSLLLIVFAEFGCSLFIIIGLFTRLATIPNIIGMLVAGFVIHSADPFAAKELSLLYFTMYLVLAMLGPGEFSLDYYLKIFKKKTVRRR